MKAVKVLLFVVTMLYTISISAQTVYVTKTGEKYHKASCRYLKYSTKEIELEKAIALGFEACKVCKPSLVTKTTANNASNEIKTLSASTTSSSSIKKTVATQCTGKTQAGTRCKRKTKNANGRCYQH